MNSIQHNTQTAKSQLIVKVRASLYQLPNGELVGFGPLEAKRGNGYEFCYNCNVSDCVHVVAVSQAWLNGQSVEANSIPFNGVAPEDDEGMIPKGDCETLVFASSAGLWPDDYAIEPVTL